MIINTGLIILAILSTGAIFLLEDWRWRLAIVSLIQLTGFILIVQIWPIALASVKLISSWMGIALLGTSYVMIEEGKGYAIRISTKIFRLMLLAFSWVLVTTTVQNLNDWLPISYTNLFVGMIFFLAGILMISFETLIMNIIFGLLIFLEGFDVIYSSLEGSALVTGIFGVILISICLAGSYLSGVFNFRGNK